MLIQQKLPDALPSGPGWAERRKHLLLSSVLRTLVKLSLMPVHAVPSPMLPGCVTTKKTKKKQAATSRQAGGSTHGYSLLHSSLWRRPHLKRGPSERVMAFHLHIEIPPLAAAPRLLVLCQLHRNHIKRTSAAVFATDTNTLALTGTLDPRGARCDLALLRC